MKTKLNTYSVHIRKCSWDDYVFCYKLAKKNMQEYVERHWSKWTPSRYRQDFNPSRTKIVLYKNRRIAYFRTRLEPKFLYIEDIQVSDSMKGKGIGSFLMKLIENNATRNNKNEIQLTVFKDNPARLFYKRLGYKVIKDEGATVLMGKKL